MSNGVAYSSGQVAKALGVKAGMVRRYHLALETVTGAALPRDPQSNGRLVDEQQLAQLTQAREVVRANPSLSVEDALKSVLGLYSGPTAPAVPREEMLEAIILELRGLRREVSAQREELTALREQNAVLHEQIQALPTPSLPSEPPRPRVIVVDNTRAAESDRINRYLLDELERRQELPAPVRRWRWPWRR